MRDVKSGGATVPGRNGRSGLLRPTTVWLAIAVLLGSSLGLIALSAFAGRSPESAAAASRPADWLWMNGPAVDSRAATQVDQAGDATPAPVGITPRASDAATPVPPSPSPSASASAMPDRSGTCYLPKRDAQPASPATPIVGGTPTARGATPAAGSATGLTRAGYPAGPADELVARDVENVVQSVSVCLSTSDYDTLNDLVQDDFRGQLLGTGESVSADDFATFAEELPPTTFTVSDVSDVTITEDGNATAVVRYLVGNQLRQGLWTFSLLTNSASFLGETDENGIVRASARWVVASEEVQNPDVPADAQSVDVTLDEYTITVDPDQVDAGTLALNISNKGDQDHEVIVVRLEDDATADELLYIPGPDLPDGISIAGQLSVDAGDDGVMVLDGLDAGSYALVDLFPDDDSGVVNLALGMEADLTVGG